MFLSMAKFHSLEFFVPEYINIMPNTLHFCNLSGLLPFYDFLFFFFLEKLVLKPTRAAELTLKYCISSLAHERALT